jgi:ornithine carbamoyltransferase
MSQLGAKYFMHCQPAHRDEEVTSEVLDSEQSIILRQAENRMWAQNALLYTLLAA